MLVLWELYELHPSYSLMENGETVKARISCFAFTSNMNFGMFMKGEEKLLMQGDFPSLRLGCLAEVVVGSVKMQGE